MSDKTICTDKERDSRHEKGSKCVSVRVKESVRNRSTAYCAVYDGLLFSSHIDCFDFRAHSQNPPFLQDAVPFDMLFSQFLNLSPD